MAEGGPHACRSQPLQARLGEAAGTGHGCGDDPGADLLIGLGNSLRGDDGVGKWLAARAERCWPDLRVRSVQQLTPELCCELATARRVLFVDAWCGPQASVTHGGLTQHACPHPVAEGPAPVAPGQPADGHCSPVLLRLRPAAADSTDVGVFSHRLDPAQLLVITGLLQGCSPQAWQLLVPAFRFAHGEGFSAELRARLPAAEALLRQWCAGDA